MPSKLPAVVPATMSGPEGPSLLGLATQLEDTTLQSACRSGWLEGTLFAVVLWCIKCNRTLYRECRKPDNRTGMCYNPRMMPISCDGSILPIKMRKRQIVEKVGDPCDPEVEAWLGCELRST